MGQIDRDIQFDRSVRSREPELPGHAPRPKFVATELVPDTIDAAISDALATLEAEPQAAAGITPPPTQPTRIRAPGASPVSAGAGGLKNEDLPGAVDSDADSAVRGLRGQKGELDKLSRELLGRADAPVSDAEAVGQLLVGLLPGLLGLTVGGAVGGTTGALAGAGGGFGGSAEGLNRLDKNRREDKDKLVGRAEKLQARMDDLERQIGLRKDRLEDRNLSQIEATKQRNQARELQNEHTRLSREQMRFTGSENAKNRWLDAKLKSEEIAQRDRDSNRDYLARVAAANAKDADSAGNRKEADMYTQASTAVDMLGKLEAAIKATGGAESDSQFSIFSDKEAAADLKTSIENFAIAYAKLVDPDSVARPEEVENAKKMIPMGWFTDDDASLRGVQTMRGIIAQKMVERKERFNQPVPEKSTHGGAGESLTKKYGAGTLTGKYGAGK